MSRIERGRCLPSLPTLVTFAEVLHSTPNQLLGFEDPIDDEELRSIVDAVYSLGPVQREEIRRIAEALARYRSEPPDMSRGRKPSGVTTRTRRSTRPPKALNDDE